jgi:hypothetical protein
VALRRPTIVPAFFLLESYLRKKTTWTTFFCNPSILKTGNESSGVHTWAVNSCAGVNAPMWTWGLTFASSAASADWNLHVIFLFGMILFHIYIFIL